MATTPPPSTSLRMPPTPRHGAGYDSYSPYATRQSARLASQRAARGSRTPEPPTVSSYPVPASPRSSKKSRGQEFDTLSPPGSPFGSPRKKTTDRTATMASNTSSLNGPEFVHPGSSQRNKRFPAHPLGVTMTDGMLPTPETPRKKNVGDVGSTARTLFSSTNPSGRSRKSKRYTGFSLDSFDENPSENQPKIEIYTDARDRIPELDTSDTNPFYQKSGGDDAPQPDTRASRKRRVSGHKRDEEVDDAVKRDDGIMYVFRGKKTFRKFREEPESDTEDDDDLCLLSARPDLADADVPTHIRPLTRSSIKPRVLFPSAHSKSGSAKLERTDVADEEVATDVEDLPAGKDSSADAASIDQADAKGRNELATPAVKSTATTPASPGAATRSLRSRAKQEHVMESHDTPTPATAHKKHNSPFSGWMRTKSAPAASASKSKKRDADPVDTNGAPVAKRSRGVTSN